MNTVPSPRRWLITGANSGLGAAFTRAALAAGDVVVAAVRRPGAMAEVADEHPDRVTVVELDVRDPAACRRVVETSGRIDVLVNNAGYGIVGAIEETTEEEVRDAFEVMFHAPLRLTRLVLRQMRERRSGAIIQVSSMGGLLSFAGAGAYCAAKGALEQASEALAAEVGPLGINVVILEPGAFRTGFAGSALRQSTPIPGYEDTVGPIRTSLAASHGNEPGDPDKAARALLNTLDLPEPPLRLALGEDAISAIRAKLKAVAADLDATADLARHTAVASQDPLIGGIL
ncbi:SDR family NAD(P)-dependent oxidoreductase [Planotetraspora kaengkrachanensis]|uniref:Short-chain dehydrogenase/reductase n=1 Tax=Planotetraspora kaengkrachanensis TaxID=575193 RepID=A0A8J3M6N0_9ACTN|nr:SDR family NAD(P)-dependent oxidoreductase [Planotetraspora kaengkrachanensis]GIG80346.1 short-chain dehydrogenase/reductase [Planotetraspora kaengkrachanensis]